MFSIVDTCQSQFSASEMIQIQPNVYKSIWVSVVGVAKSITVYFDHFVDIKFLKISKISIVSLNDNMCA